ncbi:hypothetical protein CEQ90_05565 [Lewinellaceae bacterium SD302]|nr:hypothetical protein CEQ90_05565 [Lewinellaceae bacterium SD302]
MFIKNTNRRERSTLSLPKPLNVLGGILIGIFLTYLAIYSVPIWNGEHVFSPEAVRGLAVIGLVVLGCSWYESNLKE